MVLSAYISPIFHNGIINYVVCMCICVCMHMSLNVRWIFFNVCTYFSFHKNVKRAHASMWLLMIRHNFSVWYLNSFTLVQQLIFKWIMPLLRLLGAGFSPWGLWFNPRWLHVSFMADKLSSVFPCQAWDSHIFSSSQTVI